MGFAGRNDVIISKEIIFKIALKISPLIFCMVVMVTILTDSRSCPLV